MALIFNSLICGSVLATIVIDLVVGPLFPVELNTTFISAESPGAIGVSGYEGTVQPQLPIAELIINGFFPVL
ncbi:MAG: hypothetical protein IPP53_00490 [Bacteroidetes bacterium]|nr:hypothetical protein [Bacteroidota bacterium]